MANRLQFSLIVITILVFSCKKDNPDNSETAPVTPDNPAVVSDNHLVVDSTLQDLVSSEQQIQEGIFVFNLSGGEIAEVGDILIGTQQNGFLRKVIGVEEAAGQVIYSTEFASMSEVFSGGEVSLSIDPNDSYQYRSNLAYGFNNVMVYNQGGTAIAASGSIGLDIPEFDASISFNDNFGVSNCGFSMPGASFSGEVTFNVNSSGAVSFLEDEIVLAGFTRPFYGTFGVLPVAGVITTDFVLKCSADISTAVNQVIQFENHSPISFECSYNDGVWSSNLGYQPNLEVQLGPVSGNAQLSFHAELTPTIKVEFYNVIGPYGSLSLNNDAIAAVQSPSLDWHYSSEVFMSSIIGVSATIFDQELVNYNTSWASPSLLYKTPYTIEMTSGNNQSGFPNTYLENPIQVRVKDSNGNAQSNVPVYFEVVSGGGEVSADQVLTDAGGLAEVLWELGSDVIQQVQVTARDGSGSNLISSPVTFTANSGPAFDFDYTVTADTLLIPEGTGIIFLQPLGGTYPYQFKLGADGVYQSVLQFTQVTANSYEVYGKDANDFEVVKTVEVPGI